MIPLEALVNLVKKYGFSHEDMALYLNTTKSQIGMAMSGWRDLPPHCLRPLFELHQKYSENPDSNEDMSQHTSPPRAKEQFKAVCLQRLADIFVLQLKLEKRLKKMDKVISKSVLAADGYQHLIALAPEEDVHPQFTWKLRKQEMNMEKHGTEKQLKLKMQQEILAAEAEIIKKYLGQLGYDVPDPHLPV